MLDQTYGVESEEDFRNKIVNEKVFDDFILLITYEEMRNFREGVKNLC